MMDRDTWVEQRARVEPWDLAWFDKMFERTHRPYDGQPHTDAGKRGTMLVLGLTMRDVADCVELGFFLASGLPPEEWPDSVYDLPLANVDPVAVRQNAMCNVEKMMGIFPNVPRLVAEAEDVHVQDGLL